MKAYDAVLAIPRSGRTFDNFIRQLLRKTGLPSEDFDQILSLIKSGKDQKNQCPRLAQSFFDDSVASEIKNV